MAQEIIVNNSGQAVAHLKKIKVRDYYRTPIELFKKGCKLFGIIPIIDVSESSQVFPEWMDNRMNLTPIRITEDQDLLKTPITQDAYGNLPYSKIPQLLPYLVEQHRKNRVSILLLVFGKTDTQWFDENVLQVKSAVYEKKCCITKRVRFNCQHGFPTENSAPYHNVWIFFDKKLL